MLTLGISLGSLVISLVIGLPVAVGQGCRALVVRYLCDLYVKLIRGTPLLAQIYLFYYIVGTAWGVDNRMVAGIIILSVFSGAYIAEIVRGSLTSLDQGQLEAARACGFTRAANPATHHCAAVGFAHFTGAYGAICHHCERFIPSFGYCSYRNYPNHT